jgi:hypothetical protein
MDAQQIISTFKQAGSILGTSRTLGMDRRTIRRHLTKAGIKWSESSARKTPVGSKHGQPKAKQCGLTRSELMSKYDDSTRAREAIRSGIERFLKNLPATAEEDAIIEESRFKSDFCDNVVSPAFKVVASESEFKKYRFRIGDKIFWTTPRTKGWAILNISKAREVN